MPSNDIIFVFFSLIFTEIYVYYETRDIFLEIKPGT